MPKVIKSTLGNFFGNLPYLFGGGELNFFWLAVNLA